MGFRENLKNELVYSGLRVKELSAKTGINKYTIDNYLSTHNCTPSAEAAVKIADALGVSVEYLVTGREIRHKTVSSSHEFRSLIRSMEQLGGDEQKVVIKNALNLVDILKNK
jgi:transcriptional regulator with XRE-family HTH domain